MNISGNAAVNVTDASVKTTTITADHLVINNRYMTMAMFKQISYEQILDLENIKLNGTPWGYVNYFWPDIKHHSDYESSDCLHVLWQKGNELRRALIPESIGDEYNWSMEKCKEAHIRPHINTDDIDFENDNVVTMTHTSKFKSYTNTSLLDNTPYEVSFPHMVLQNFQIMFDKVRDKWEKAKVINPECPLEAAVAGNTFIREKFSSVFYTAFNEYYKTEIQAFNIMGRKIWEEYVDSVYMMYVQNQLNPKAVLLYDLKHNLPQLFVGR